MLETHLPTDRIATGPRATTNSGLERELLNQYKLPAGVTGACNLDGACSTFKPDYHRSTPSARAWDRDARQQRSANVDAPDGKYDVKQGDSLWGIAERLIKRDGGKSSAAEVHKRVKELVEANKSNLPGLDCNPHLLKRGTKLNIPGHSDSSMRPAQKPENSTDTPAAKPVETPTDRPTDKPIERSPESPTESPTEAPTEAPMEIPTEVRPPASVARPSEIRPEGRTPEAPAKTDERQGDVCQPRDIYRDLAKFPDLKTAEYMTACRISRALIDGDPETIKRAMNDFPTSKESGERIAKALNETFKEQGIVVGYNQMDFRRASTPDKQESVGTFTIYRRGSDKYLEVGKDSLGLAGPVLMEPGGPINYGLVSYQSEAMREAALNDMSAAMKKRYCP